MSEQMFAVFLNTDRDPALKGSWTAYSYWVDESWPGFQGWISGSGATRRKRMADAINKARDDYYERTAP